MDATGDAAVLVTPPGESVAPAGCGNLQESHQQDVAAKKGANGGLENCAGAQAAAQAPAVQAAPREGSDAGTSDNSCTEALDGGIAQDHTRELKTEPMDASHSSQEGAALQGAALAVGQQQVALPAESQPGQLLVRQQDEAALQLHVALEQPEACLKRKREDEGGHLQQQQEQQQHPHGRGSADQPNGLARAADALHATPGASGKKRRKAAKGKLSMRKNQRRRRAEELALERSGVDAPPGANAAEQRPIAAKPAGDAARPKADAAIAAVKAEPVAVKLEPTPVAAPAVPDVQRNAGSMQLRTKLKPKRVGGDESDIEVDVKPPRGAGRKATAGTDKARPVRRAGPRAQPRVGGSDDEEEYEYMWGCSGCNWNKAGCATCKARGEPLYERRKYRWRPDLARRQDGVPCAPTYRPTAEEFKDPLAYIRKIRKEAERYGIACIVPPDDFKPPFAIDKASNGIGANNFMFNVRKQMTSHLCMRRPGAAHEQDPEYVEDDDVEEENVDEEDEAERQHGQQQQQKGEEGSTQGVAAAAEAGNSGAAAAGQRKQRGSGRGGGGAGLASSVQAAAGRSKYRSRRQVDDVCNLGNQDFGFIYMEEQQSFKQFAATADWIKERHFRQPTPKGDPHARPIKRHKSYNYRGPQPSVEEVEGEFWRIVEQPDGVVESLYGQDIDSGYHGSGFPLPSFRLQMLEQRLKGQQQQQGQQQQAGESACAAGQVGEADAAGKETEESPAAQAADAAAAPAATAAAPAAEAAGAQGQQAAAAGGTAALPPQPQQRRAAGAREAEDRRYRYHRWNINNLPRSEGSMLRHVVGDELITGVMVPWLYIGSALSAFCWHIEDHGLCSINYMHMGAPKVWYGVPGHASRALEGAMRDALPHLFDATPNLIYQLVTMVSPTQLQQRGVPVYRLVHHEGSFVITFPSAYHAGFNTGFNCAEAVNFAPADWIPWGTELADKYRKDAKPFTVSHDALIVALAQAADRLQQPNGAAAAAEGGGGPGGISLRPRRSEVIQGDEPQVGESCLDSVTPEAIRLAAGELALRTDEEERRRRAGLGEVPSIEALRMRGPKGGRCPHSGLPLNTEDRDCDVCKCDLYLSAVVSPACPGRAVCPEHAASLLPGGRLEGAVLLYRHTPQELRAMVAAAVAAVPGAEEAIEEARGRKQRLQEAEPQVRKLGPIKYPYPPESAAAAAGSNPTRKAAAQAKDGDDDGDADGQQQQHRVRRRSGSRRSAGARRGAGPRSSQAAAAAPEALGLVANGGEEGAEGGAQAGAAGAKPKGRSGTRRSGSRQRDAKAAGGHNRAGEEQAALELAPKPAGNDAKPAATAAAAAAGPVPAAARDAAAAAEAAADAPLRRNTAAALAAEAAEIAAAKAAAAQQLERQHAARMQRAMRREVLPEVPVRRSGIRKQQPSDGAAEAQPAEVAAAAAAEAAGATATPQQQCGSAEAAATGQAPGPDTRAAAPEGAAATAAAPQAVPQAAATAAEASPRAAAAPEAAAAAAIAGPVPLQAVGGQLPLETAAPGPAAAPALELMAGPAQEPAAALAELVAAEPAAAEAAQDTEAAPAGAAAAGRAAPAEAAPTPMDTDPTPVAAAAVASVPVTQAAMQGMEQGGAVQGTAALATGAVGTGGAPPHQE